MTCASLTCQDKNSSGLNTPPATVQQNQMRERHCPAREAGKGPQTPRAGPAGHPGATPLGRSLWEPNRLEELSSTRPSPQRSALRAGLGRGGWWNRGPVLRGKGLGRGSQGAGSPVRGPSPHGGEDRSSRQSLWSLWNGQQALCPGQSPGSRRLSSCPLQSKREVKGPGRAWEHPWLVWGGGPRESEGSRLRGQHHHEPVLREGDDPRGGSSELT